MTIRTRASREVYRNPWMKVPIAEFEALIQGGHIKDSATLSAYCLLRMQQRIPGL